MSVKKRFQYINYAFGPETNFSIVSSQPRCFADENFIFVFIYGKLNWTFRKTYDVDLNVSSEKLVEFLYVEISVHIENSKLS
jgi:hypothetical protein